MDLIFLQVIGKESTLNLRIPVWTNSESAKVSLNKQSLKVPASGNLTFCIVTSVLKIGPAANRNKTK